VGQGIYYLHFLTTKSPRMAKKKRGGGLSLLRKEINRTEKRLKE
jgi:hypothetical protein